MDQEQWDAVLAQRERLLRLARARGVSPEDAKDVVQEAMLRCAEFEALDPERLGQFLTTVTVRLCADVHRRHQEPVRARRWLAPMLHDEPDPADLICRDHGQEWVASLVERLPERQRHVIFDRARGLTIQQIATRHRLTYKAAESALARARAALRHAVAASMSVAAFLTRRTRRHDVAITASAAAFVVTAAVLGSPSVPDRVRVAPAPSPRAGFVDGGASPAPVPFVGSTSQLPRPSLTPPPPSSPGRRRPTPSPTYDDPVPTFTVSASPIGGIGYREDGYAPGEHVLHCVQYGISTYPTVRCNYPSPTPTPKPGERP